MGLFDRRRGRDPESTAPDAAASDRPPPTTRKATASLYGGDETLEVVGESYRQDVLWRIVGSQPADQVRHPVRAVLVPEDTNPHDPNTIGVQIEGHLVGYLSRENAAKYRPGLLALMQQDGNYIALKGTVIGGGGDRGSLGVFLEHDPTDFGLSPNAPPQFFEGEMRTGFSEAWHSDIDDDSYDMSWFTDLPSGDRDAIATLSGLLASDPDPIDRHFQFAELEARLYRCRDLYDTALDEYDDVCRRHDAEMDVICEQFKARWQKVPLLDTYRQMAIRQQKLKDWDAVLWWAERGLALYGEQAARAEAVEDLMKRRNRARAKLEAAPPSA